MNVDEAIADVRRALMLNDQQVLVNVIMLGEWIELDDDALDPERRRLAMFASEELEPWTSIGMLEFAKMQEHRAVQQMDDDQ